MFIETVLFLGLAIAVSAAIVKVYEWWQDVVYGPYLKPSDYTRTEDR